MRLFGSVRSAKGRSSQKASEDDEEDGGADVSRLDSTDAAALEGDDEGSDEDDYSGDYMGHQEDTPRYSMFGNSSMITEDAGDTAEGETFQLNRASRRSGRPKYGADGTYNAEAAEASSQAAAKWVHPRRSTVLFNQVVPPTERELLESVVASQQQVLERLALVLSEQRSLRKNVVNFEEIAKLGTYQSQGSYASEEPGKRKDDKIQAPTENGEEKKKEEDKEDSFFKSEREEGDAIDDSFRNSLDLEAGPGAEGDDDDDDDDGNKMGSGLPPAWPATLMIREKLSRDRQSHRFCDIALRKAGVEQSSGLRESIYNFEIALPDSAHTIKNCSSYFLLNPSSSIRIGIDVFSLFVLAYDLTITPYILAWDVGMDGPIKWFALLGLLFWTCDIVLSFRTGFYQDGEISMDGPAIARRYMRSFFLPDLAVVTGDWISIISYTMGASQSVEGTKLLRFAKVGRLLRIIGFLRVIRISESLERILDRSFSSKTGGHMVMIEISAILCAILWLNHLAACLWFALGRLGETQDEIRDSWLSTPILPWGDGSQTFSEMEPMFQYFTAYHWSMTQMTPGSMQVFPLNSVERIFNILCLVVGLVIFSTLISSLSAKLTQFRMERQGKQSKLKVLRRFICQTGLNTELAVSLQKQVAYKMSIEKPLSIKDVSAIEFVSLSLRMRLCLELYKPCLLQDPFFRLWAELDSDSLGKLCFEGIDSVALLPGDDLFLPGTEAPGAFCTQTGTLVYAQSPASSKVTKRCEEIIDVGQWVCKAALWCHWTTVGGVQAMTASELMLIRAEGFVNCVFSHHLFRRIAVEFAGVFHKRITSLRPPTSWWPSDMQVASTDFGDVIMALPFQVRRFISVHAIQVLLRGSFWAWWKVSRLMRQVQDGKCTLMLGRTGDIERIVLVVVLRAVQADGRIFSMLALTSDQGADIRCMLPGKKRKLGETPQDTIHRLIKEDLGPLANRIEFTSVEETVEYKESEFWGIWTKYIKTVQHATLDVTEALPLRPCGKTALRSEGLGRTSCQLSDTEVYCVDGERDRRYYVWLSQKDFEYARSAVGRNHLAPMLENILEADRLRDSVTICDHWSKRLNIHEEDPEDHFNCSAPLGEGQNSTSSRREAASRRQAVVFGEEALGNVSETDGVVHLQSETPAGDSVIGLPSASGPNEKWRTEAV